jgi:DNA polymerase V
MDLFTAYKAVEEERAKEKKIRERERRAQEAVLAIKKKYGKNAILKGMNLEEGAQTIARNSQIGGHKA